MVKKEASITGASILGILILIYFINQICIAIFKPLLIISIIGLIIAIILTFNQTDYLVYVWITIVALFFLTGASYICGHGFYNTDIGKSLVDAGNTSYDAVNTINEAEKTVEETMKNASKQIIDETINATNPTDPNIQNIGEISKQLIDIS